PAAAVAPVAPAKPVTKPVVHKPATPAPAPEEPWYMQIWVLAAGAVAVVLLLLLALRGRRKPAVAKTAVAASSASLADRFGTAPSAASANSLDPDQDELLDQLAEHPDDVGLHLELVSLYYSRRDVDHFEAAAEAMHAHVTHADQDEWQDVVHMGEDLVPGHPLFAHAAPPSPPPLPPQNEDEHEALHHFDLDSYATEPAQDQHDAAAANRPKVSEYHYDFDLTPKQTEAAAAAKHHESASASAVSSDDETVVSNWKFDESAEPTHAHAESGEHEFGELQDDPIDTKLDLARAYLDMGDPDGARAMLDEVMNEGSQMQRDVAKGLLAKLR
ncbi:MAG: FimV/HubP family polar landmark protein, partial [Rhodanobacter sp.]